MSEPTDKKDLTREEKIEQFRGRTSLITKESLSKSIGELNISQNKKVEIGKKLRERGITPEKFIFWHILIDSTPPPEEIKDLDTIPGDIERLVDETFPNG